MGALILLAMVAVWYGLGRLLWRLLGPWRESRQPIAKSWAVALIVAWMVAPWIDEIWGSWVFKRECDAMPETMLNIPVAVGAGAFFDETGKRKLWTDEEVRRGLSPFPRTDPKVSYAEHLKFTEAFDREFPNSTMTRHIRSVPIPILEDTNIRRHARTGKVVRESRMLISPGGWIRRTTGFGAHAPRTCYKPGKGALHEEWIKFE